jgi:hypothetical protein
VRDNAVVEVAPALLALPAGADRAIRRFLDDYHVTARERASRSPTSAFGTGKAAGREQRNDESRARWMLLHSLVVSDF